MNMTALRHNLVWNTKAGRILRLVAGGVGYQALRLGQALLRWSLHRCSLCGAICGFDSEISKKGKRCVSLHRNCWEHP